jgi:NAD(P)H-nitrite reductase large subunit
MEDIEICNCNGIMKSEIVKAIKEKGLKTVEEVQDEQMQELYAEVAFPTLRIS